LHEGMNANTEFKKLAWKQAFEGKVDLLVEALDRLFSQDQRHRLWLEISRAEWIHSAKSYGIYIASLDVTKIVRTILLGRSKTLHIDRMSVKPIDEKAAMFSKRAYSLLWSEESRDLETNLELMWERASGASEKELSRFVEQFDQMDTEYTMIKMGVAYVLEQQKKGRNLKKLDPSEVFEVMSNGLNFPHMSKYTTNSIMEAGMVNWAHATHVKDDFLAVALVIPPISNIIGFPDGMVKTTPRTVNYDVEELRKRNKILILKLPFARTIRACLSSMSNQSDYAAPDPVVEAVFLAYIDTPMYLATDELRREVLKDLELGHIVIPKRMNKGTTLDRYQHPSESN